MQAASTSALATASVKACVAFWVKASEEGVWHLYIASPAVNPDKVAEASRTVYGSLSKLPNPWVSPSEIKLLNGTGQHAGFITLDFTGGQSAWFRVHNRDDHIPNLYFVGAGTHPGAGIPGVVGSAKATAALMLETER